MSSIRQLYAEGNGILERADIADAAIDARELLMYVLKIDRNYMLMHPDEDVDEVKKSEYLELIDKRSAHIPLQHITGVQGFMGLDFIVNENVLIPRQDTECLVEEAMIEIDDGMQVLDMCTGSGCIIISLMKYKNNLETTAVDISEAALSVARENARLNNVEVNFIRGDKFDALKEAGIEGRYDAIISNPPYIASDVIETLMPEVRDHEPRIALDGDSDGLRFYRDIIEGAESYLAPGGVILFEIGYDQGEEVSRLLEVKGYIDVCVVKDLAGLDRVVKGRKRCLIS